MTRARLRKYACHDLSDVPPTARRATQQAIADELKAAAEWVIGFSTVENPIAPSIPELSALEQVEQELVDSKRKLRVI